MLWKQPFAIATTLLVLLGIVTDAIANSSLHHGKRRVVSRHHFQERSGFMPGFAYGAPDGLPMSPTYRFRGYGFVPDGCNLPTNLCPNELRD